MKKKDNESLDHLMDKMLKDLDGVLPDEILQKLKTGRLASRKHRKDAQQIEEDAYEFARKVVKQFEKNVFNAWGEGQNPAQALDNIDPIIGDDVQIASYYAKAMIIAQTNIDHATYSIATSWRARVIQLFSKSARKKSKDFRESYSIAITMLMMKRIKEDIVQRYELRDELKETNDGLDGRSEREAKPEEKESKK